MEQQQQHQQNLIDLPKLLAGGIAAPVATLLTSRFGIGGTIIGLGISAVVVTTISDILKVYLARVPGTVTRIPGGFSKKPRWQRILYSFRLPFSKFSSLDPARRRSILIRSLIAGVIAFLIGLIVVTGVEASVGKSLSCWVWNNCPTASSTSTGSNAAATSTLPSILGGGQGTISSTLQVGGTSSNSQQQQGVSPPGTPQAPSQTPLPSEVPGAQTPKPSVSAQPGQRQGPSGVSQDQQQPPSSSAAPANQQQISLEQQPSYSERQRSSSAQQQNSYSDSYQQGAPIPPASESAGSQINK